MKVNVKQTCLVRSLLAFVALLILSETGSVSVVRADTQNCTPNADEIAVFRDEDFNGPCLIKGIGEYPNFETGFSPGGYSSVKVGSNVEALICTMTDFRGDPCSFVYADSRSQRDTWRSFYPRSMIVRLKSRARVCHPSDDQVAVWDYKYFFGKCQNVNLGVYPFATEPLLAGSLRVGRNVEARLCDDERFTSDCMVLTPGHHSHWDFRRDGAILIADVRALQVQRRNQPPDCVPGANEVALFQYGNFIGPCRLFGLGEYSSQDSVRWAHHGVSSMQIGNNVEAVLCEERGTLRRCGRGNTLNIRDLVNRSFALIVRRRGETARLRQSRDEQPPPPVVLDYSLLLGANPLFAGYPSWSGSFPTQGRLDGNLIGVTNPRRSVWVGFLKRGKNAGDCGDLDAFIVLQPGQSLSANQLETLFGSRTPNLPVQFFVCSGASSIDGGRTFPGVRLNLTYTRRDR